MFYVAMCNMEWYLNLYMEVISLGFWHLDDVYSFTDNQCDPIQT